ncbi:MAG: hypothetical protein HC837_01165 [Chloroflexaceae bacterium]|nr:hypothetical protein [Chloroflexaceae bacterium]
MSQHNTPQWVLDDLLTNFGQVHLPAYVIDDYCDIIATNEATVKLLEIDQTPALNLYTAMQQPFGLNMMQFVFSPAAIYHFQERMGNQWYDYAYQNMMLFRAYSFSYRTTDYCRALLQQLRKYNQFRVFWEMTGYQEVWASPLPYETFLLKTVTGGTLSFSSTTITAVSAVGNLYLCMYVPVDPHTASVFQQILAGCRSEMQRVDLCWPEKVVEQQE